MSTGDLVTRVLLAALVGGASGACGDDGAATDGGLGDAAALDGPSFPAAPALGAQLDRRGRPVVATMLVAPLETPQRQTAMRDAYEGASDPATWADTVLDATAIPPRTIRAELAASLGMLDGLDAGHPDITQAGCGNAPMYEGPPSTASYEALATLLADDQLYLDTEKTVCDRYLALEVGAALGVTSSGCGGRALTNDVVDTTYSLLVGGEGAFTSPGFTPRIGDGADAHPDVLDTTFPFLGAPR